MFEDNVVITGKCYNLFRGTIKVFEEMVNDYLYFKDYEATITSANDSDHSLNSLHYKNKAIDVRIKDLAIVSSWKKKILEAIVIHLGFVESDKVFILHLYDGKDHLHIQYGRDNIISFDNAVGENKNVFIK